MIIELTKSMPINTLAAFINEHDTRIWRIVHHYLGEAFIEQDCSPVTAVGVDETASKRGHNYVTTFVDLKSSKVLFVTERRKDAATVQAF